jgi:phosphohistidine phosphatase
MKIYLLRHGIAEDYHPGGSDKDRELTPEGIRQVEAVAGSLSRLQLKLDRIITSPYPRACQTAEIVAHILILQEQMAVDDRLAPGFHLGDLQAIVEDQARIERWMFVGHNPDLPIIAGQLVGGAAIDMKKAGLIRVDTEHVEPGVGILEWVLTPATLTRS